MAGVQAQVGTWAVGVLPRRTALTPSTDRRRQTAYSLTNGAGKRDPAACDRSGGFGAYSTLVEGLSWAASRSERDPRATIARDRAWKTITARRTSPRGAAEDDRSEMERRRRRCAGLAARQGHAVSRFRTRAGYLEENVRAASLRLDEEVLGRLDPSCRSARLGRPLPDWARSGSNGTRPRVTSWQRCRDAPGDLRRAREGDLPVERSSSPPGARRGSRHTNTVLTARGSPRVTRLSGCGR